MCSICPTISKVSFDCKTVTKIGLISIGALLAVGVLRSFSFPSPAASWAQLGIYALSIGLVVREATKDCRLKKKDIPNKPIVLTNSSLVNVPKDIWSHIFSYLDSHSLGRCQRVCSGFYHIAQEERLWKELGKKCDLPSFVERPISKSEFLQNIKFVRAVEKGARLRSTILDGEHGILSLYYANGWLFSDGNGLNFWKFNETDQKWECLQVVKEHFHRVTKVVYANDWLFSVFDYKTLKAWKLNQSNQKWECKQTLGDFTIRSLFYANGQLFSGNNHEIKVWRLEEDGQSYKCVQTLTSRHDVNCLFYADGLLFSAIAEIIEVWKLDESGQKWSCIQKMRHVHGIYSGNVLSLFYANGLLFSGSADDTINIWKLDESGQKWSCTQKWDCIQTLNGQKYGVRTLFHANGLLFSGLGDGLIKIWKLNAITQKWEHLRNLEGHEGIVQQLFYSKGLLFSGSTHLNNIDHTLRVWKPDDTI